VSPGARALSRAARAAANADFPADTPPPRPTSVGRSKPARLARIRAARASIGSSVRGSRPPRALTPRSAPPGRGGRRGRPLRRPRPGGLAPELHGFRLWSSRELVIVRTAEGAETSYGIATGSFHSHYREWPVG